MEHTGGSYEEADNFVRVKIRASFPILRTKQGGKFILGVTRMYVNNELNDGETQARLNTVLKYVSDPTHVNQYDRNLNNLSAEELIRRFASVQVQDMEKDRNEVGSIQREVNSDYTVVPINSFEEAAKYGKYNDWCLAQENGEGMYDEYTKKGINQLYFIIRKGFENEPRKAGPNTPFDSYGLSMMTVIVDPDGQMAQSTTRWNHDNGSSDSVLTTKQISDIIGRNFYDVFKPNNRFKDAVSMAMNKFSNGTPADDAFDEYVPCKDGPHLIRVMGRWNAIKPSEDKKAGPVLLSKIWYDDMFPFFEGYAKVSDDNKGSNFINEQGQLLLKRWYFDVGYFKGGVAPVFDIKRGWTAINRNGELITDKFFTGMGFAGSGMLKVRSGLGQNFLTAEGKLLSDEWFDDVAVFRDGIAKVARSSKYNFINMQGRLLSELWFDRVGKMSPDGAVVMVAGRGYNYLKPNGRLLLKQWMDYTEYTFPIHAMRMRFNRKTVPRGSRKTASTIS